MQFPGTFRFMINDIMPYANFSSIFHGLFASVLPTGPSLTNHLGKPNTPRISLHASLYLCTSIRGSYIIVLPIIFSSPSGCHHHRRWSGWSSCCGRHEAGQSILRCPRGSGRVSFSRSCRFTLNGLLIPLCMLRSHF